MSIVDIVITFLPVLLIGGLFFWLFYRRPIVSQKAENKRDKDVIKHTFIIGGITLVAIALITAFTLPARDSQLQEVPFTKVIDYSTAGQIKRIELTGDELIITIKGESFPTLRSYKSSGTSLQDQGIDTNNIELEVRP